VRIDTDKYQRTLDRLLPRVMCSGSRDLLNFCEISDNISETVQGRDVVIMEVSTNTKLIRNYVAYQIAPVAMTLSDLEGHILLLKPFYIARISYDVFTRESESSRGL